MFCNNKNIGKLENSKKERERRGEEGRRGGERNE